MTPVLKCHELDLTNILSIESVTHDFSNGIYISFLIYKLLHKSKFYHTHSQIVVVNSPYNLKKGEITTILPPQISRNNKELYIPAKTSVLSDCFSSSFWHEKKPGS